MNATPPTRLGAAAIAARFVSPCQLAVFVQLLALADESDTWRGKYETLAIALGRSWSSVARAFAQLQRAGLIAKLSDQSTSATWRVIWQKCYSKNDMAFPPDPPELLLTSVGITIPPPPPTHAPRLGEVETEPLDKEGHAARALLLAAITDPTTRAKMAAERSSDEIKMALVMVGRSRPRDPGALLVHVLRSGAALAELRQQNGKIAMREEQKKLAEIQKRALAVQRQREMEQLAQEAREDRALIAQATAQQLASAAAHAAEESPVLRAVLKNRRDDLALACQESAIIRAAIADALRVTCVSDSEP